jgi:TonB family protein
VSAKGNDEGLQRNARSLQTRQSSKKRKSQGQERRSVSTKDTADPAVTTATVSELPTQSDGKARRPLFSATNPSASTKSQDGANATTRPIETLSVTTDKLGIEGDVVLEAMMHSDGSVESVRVLSGNPLLVNTAINAVRSTKYRSARSSNPMKTIKVQFSLPHER